MALESQGRSVTVVGQDNYWRRAVEVTVGHAGKRMSEEEPECTDHAAFSEVIRTAAQERAPTHASTHASIHPSIFTHRHTCICAPASRAWRKAEASSSLRASNSCIAHTSRRSWTLSLRSKLGREEARRRRCQPQDYVKNPNPMGSADWDDLVWPAHVRYVESSLAPLAARVRKVQFPQSDGDVEATVQTIARELGLQSSLNECGHSRC